MIPHNMTTTSPNSRMALGKQKVHQSITNEPYIFATIGAEPRRSGSLKNFSYRKTLADQVLPGSFRQELIYNGRTTDTVKFLYRELKDSYLRAPFTQEVTYDLKDGSEIGFKGARLKIIEASNTKIKYVVTRKFDESKGSLNPAPVAPR